jgi:hypothetical protein
MTDDDDARRPRLARAPLVDLNLAALGAVVVARLAPRSEPWLGPPRGPLLLLVLASFAVGSIAFVRGPRRGRWSLLDDAAWALLLVSTAAMAGASSAPLGLQTAVHAAALIALATRDPSDLLMVVAGASAALGPLVRAASSATPVAPVAIASSIAMLAFMFVVSLTRRLIRAIADRNALVQELARVARTPMSPPAPARRERRTSLPPTPARAIPRRASADDDEPASWDALGERVRQNVAALAESNGVASSVTVDVSGLAPPSARLRTNLLKIVLEAAQQTIRLAEPKSIAVTLRRGRGGVHIEFSDDADGGDGAGHRRAIGSVKSRISALGGTAEVARGDRGWTLRVQLPAEQLN